MSYWFQITHSVLPINTEKKFDVDTTIASLKDKLYALTGTAPGGQSLQLINSAGALVANLDNDAWPLKLYPIVDHIRIHVIDTDPGAQAHAAALTDVSKIEKYEISDQEYSKRDDTFRKFKEKLAAAKKPAADDPDAVIAKQKEKQDKEQAETHETAVGAQYKLGEVQFKPGFWVGVQLDEPTGKHNGTVGDVKYFECESKYGAFFRPTQLQVGDFPEIDELADDDDDDDDDEEI